MSQYAGWVAGSPTCSTLGRGSERRQEAGLDLRWARRESKDLERQQRGTLGASLACVWLSWAPSCKQKAWRLRQACAEPTRCYVPIASTRSVFCSWTTAWFSRTQKPAHGAAERLLLLAELGVWGNPQKRDLLLSEQHCVHHRRGHCLAQSLHTQSGDHRPAASASPGAGEKCTARGLPQTHWIRVCRRGKSTEDTDARSSSRSPPLAGLPRGHARSPTANNPDRLVGLKLGCTSDSPEELV